MLVELDALLAQNDASAVALFREHGPRIRRALGHRGAEFSRFIMAFDFEAAREILRTLAPFGAA